MLKQVSEQKKTKDSQEQGKGYHQHADMFTKSQLSRHIGHIMQEDLLNENKAFVRTQKM